MTINRLCTLTAETQTVNDLSIFIAGGTTLTTSSTKARTGTYSYRVGTLSSAFGRSFDQMSACRVGYWVNHVGITAGATINLFMAGAGVDVDESPLIRVMWDDNVGEIHVLRADGTGSASYETLATASVPASMTANDTWFHLGFTYYSHASSGFLVMRVNGVKILELLGDTRLARWGGSGDDVQYFSTDFTQIHIAGRTTGVGSTWNNFAYIDDIYIDSYESEIDAPVPARRFLTRIANGAGVDAAWTPLASTNVSQIDDGQPDGGANDGDATYNYTDTLNERDTFTKASVTIPSGYRIVGLNVFAHCKTLDVGPEISMHLWDGSSYGDGVDLVPPLDYTIEVAHRFTALPDASPFTETDVNNLGIGYRSVGTFV